MKIIGDTWFTTHKANFGIVLYEDRHGNIKSKIDIVHGKDLDADIKNIIDYGSSFPVEAAIVLMECKKRYFYEIKKKTGIDMDALTKKSS